MAVNPNPGPEVAPFTGPQLLAEVQQTLAPRHQALLGEYVDFAREACRVSSSSSLEIIEQRLILHPLDYAVSARNTGRHDSPSIPNDWSPQNTESRANELAHQAVQGGLIRSIDRKTAGHLLRLTLHDDLVYRGRKNAAEGLDPGDADLYLRMQASLLGRVISCTALGLVRH